MRLTTQGVRGSRPRKRGSAACARASALRAAVSTSPRARKNAAGSPRSLRFSSGSAPVPNACLPMRAISAWMRSSSSRPMRWISAAGSSSEVWTLISFS